jgi:F0F1-type ATP synthase assembly protein I
MKEKKPIMAMVSEYTALAFLLPTSTFVGYVIGYLLDKAFGTHFLYLVFLLIGIASGFVQLIRQLMRDTGDDGS